MDAQAFSQAFSTDLERVAKAGCGCGCFLLTVIAVLLAAIVYLGWRLWA